MKKIKYGKILLVIFLTVLIWIKADLAKTEKFEVTGRGSITLSKSVPSGLIATIGDNQATAALKKITLVGSTSKVAEARRRLNEGSLKLDFFLDIVQEKLTGPGEHNIDTENLIKKNDKMRELGLTVESVIPSEITVKVVELEKRSLDVVCYNNNGIELKAKSIEPAKVDIFVPKDWQGRSCRVELSEDEIKQAKSSFVEAKPSVVASAGMPLNALTTVKISLSSDGDSLDEYPIQAPTLGFVLNPTIQGKYEVEVENLDEIIRPITIKATLQAKQAYDKMPYKLLLEIWDEDIKAATSDQPLRRNVVYNFPPEFVSKGEIAPKSSQPIEAKFKLVPIATEAETETNKTP